MNVKQLEFKSGRGGTNQTLRILDLLMEMRGFWVPMPELAKEASPTRCGIGVAVHSRIADVRRMGFSVEHKNEWVDGQCHSFYRIDLAPGEAVTHRTREGGAAS